MDTKINVLKTKKRTSARGYFGPNRLELCSTFPLLFSLHFGEIEFW